MEREFKGIWIPKEIWLNEDLSALEKVIFAEIDSLDNNNQECCAGNEYLAKFCKCSQRKVSEAIKKLIDLKLIEVKGFDGRHRFLQSRLAKTARLDSRKCEPEQQKVRAININNNIDINNICSSGDERLGKR